jgi:hypothetical protein
LGVDVADESAASAEDAVLAPRRPLGGASACGKAQPSSPCRKMPPPIARVRRQAALAQPAGLPEAAARRLTADDRSQSFTSLT